MNFTIPGKPQPKQRPRRGAGGRFYTPQKTRAFEQLVMWLALQARPVGWPKDRRYAVEITVVCPDKRKRDIDNIAKSILDGMNDVAWLDDGQVDQLHIERVAGDAFATKVVVTEVADE